MSNLFIKTGANFSEDKRYRYSLWRIWDESKPLVMFIGLNPSTANESDNDPTIKSCIRIAQANGYGGFYMMNLFPFVSTYPNDLLDFYDTPFHDIEDTSNLDILKDVSKNCEVVVFAWGSFKQAEKRAEDIIKMFPNAKALHINKNGSPKHPLYCKSDTKLINYK